MLLHYVQQPRIVYIAGIKPLNMEMCLAVSSDTISNDALLKIYILNSFMSFYFADIENLLFVSHDTEFVRQMKGHFRRGINENE